MIIYKCFWYKYFKNNDIIDFSFIQKIIKDYNINIKNNILIYSCFGHNKLNFDMYKDYKKIYYTQEIILDDKNADYVIGFLKDKKDKYIQLRNYEVDELVKYSLDYKIYKSLNENWHYKPKNKFCCFIVSNGGPWNRRYFYQELSKYKHIDSMGLFKKNCNLLDEIDNKTNRNISRTQKTFYDIISEYKFMICFENTCRKDYITEKIYNSFKAGTVPIYFGASNIAETFNPKSFIYVKNHKMRSKRRKEFARVIELIKKIDNNEILYKKFFDEKPILDSELNDNRIHNNILKIKNLLN